jgi:hypothetical protein
MNLKRGNGDDESGHDAKDSPTNRSYRVTVQTRRRHRLSEALVGLELLFDFSQDALFVVGETHTQIIPPCRLSYNAAEQISLWPERRLPWSSGIQR